MKLMTAAAALELLGPIHRSAVEWRAAPPLGDTLAGPHHVRGLGHTELNAEATSRWLKSMRDAGVQRITGEVLLDRSSYTPSRVDLSTPPFDESPEFRYNVVPDALAFNTNLMGLRLSANSDTFSVTMDPPLPGVVLNANFKLIDRKCADWENGWVLPQVRVQDKQSVVALSGTFPRNCKASTEINVIDRSLFAAAWLQLHWQQLGGVWDATVRELTDGQAAPALPLQARAASRPLAETLRTINKSSDNPVTRMTYLALAEHAPTTVPGTATTAQKAEQTLRSWMVKNQIDDTGLVMDNGSGLSRSERISANTVAQTLQVMARSNWAPEFMSSLPIVGVDGTMRNRGKGSPAAERARMKTGTLRNAYALAGYVQNKAGDWQVVVAMVNHEQVGGTKARQLLDAVLQWAATSE